MVKNSLGRKIPEVLFGKQLIPFRGVYHTFPDIQPMDPPYAKPSFKYHKRETRRVYDSLEQVIRKVGLRDNQTISFHHCLRNGDSVLNLVLDTITQMDIKNLTLSSTALFPVHEKVLRSVLNGTITRIEGSMNGSIGIAVSTGEVECPTVLRSHGGRAGAISMGKLNIDVAFIAASSGDRFGNLNGIDGPSAFGSMGYPKGSDMIYAEHVVGITDNIVEGGLHPISIPSGYVDYVVHVDKIGDPTKIATGSLGRKPSEEQLMIAETVAQVIEASGKLKNGFTYQAGAGAISLASTAYLEKTMTDKSINGSFIFGGITESAVELLQSGKFETIYDAQSFDLKAIESLRNDPRHVEISIDHAYNIFNRGCLANYIDFSVLGATEVDIDFNANVVTHSDGLLLHGIGGHQDSAMSNITILTVPLARKVPIIVDEVTTVSTPGECIDVIVTNDGIAVNPRRQKLKEQLIKAGLPIENIRNLRDKAYSQASPLEVDYTDEIVSIVEWRDGTILDVIHKVTI
ncbi:MAG: citrate lyase subunit alpha [Candidatus Hermodarchaeota archaeon]